ADQVWTGSPENWNLRRDYYRGSGFLNWAWVNDNGSVRPFESNALNQYTSVSRQSVGYDGNFNMSGYDGVAFSYDAENHLVGGSMQATYDGLGRCVRRTINGATRLFTYDEWNAILEWDQGGNFFAWNIYGERADEILLRSDTQSGWKIYKQDKQGNVVALLGKTGDIIEKYTYDAFGKPTVTNADGTGARTSSNFGNRFMFQGREYIVELGLYDYRHRYYHPSLGRFLQTDPMGLQTEVAT